MSPMKSSPKQTNGCWCKNTSVPLPLRRRTSYPRCVLFWLPEIHSRTKLRFPTVGTCLTTSPYLGFLFFPVSLPTLPPVFPGITSIGVLVIVFASTGAQTKTICERDQSFCCKFFFRIRCELYWSRSCT